MRSWMIAGAVAGCAVSTIAYADQCAVLDEAGAARVVDVLRRDPDIVSFCEPCGDAAPGVPVRIAHAVARRIPAGFEVVVDGRSIDLAYTYVQTSSHRYENLAALVACPTTGVSPSLAIDDATSTGVLIHADQGPARHEPAATIYVVTASSSGVDWDVVVLACGLALGVWWFGAVLRRRRAMRPRATDL